MVTVKEAKKLGLYQGDEKTDLSMTRLLIEKFFGEDLPKGVDYRDAVVEYALKNKLSISSDTNIVDEMFDAVFKARCPRCSTEMEYDGGSGNGEAMSRRYNCACGFSVGVTLLCDGGVRFGFGKK